MRRKEKRGKIWMKEDQVLKESRVLDGSLLSSSSVLFLFLSWPFNIRFSNFRFQVSTSGRNFNQSFLSILGIK